MPGSARWPSGLPPIHPCSGRVCGSRRHAGRPAAGPGATFLEGEALARLAEGVLDARKSQLEPLESGVERRPRGVPFEVETERRICRMPTMKVSTEPVTEEKAAIRAAARTSLIRGSGPGNP